MNRPPFCGDPFRPSLRLGTMDHEGRNKETTPERRWNAIAQGPCRSTKGRNRLMPMMHEGADTPPPPAEVAA